MRYTHTQLAPTTHTGEAKWPPSLRLPTAWPSSSQSISETRRPRRCLEHLRQILTICTTDSGIKPRAKTSPALKNTCIEAQSSNNGRKCSFVMPEGPAAAPLREDRRHQRNNFSSRSKGKGGTCSNTSLGNGSRGLAGLLLSSVNIERVIRSRGKCCTFEGLPS